MFIANDDSLSRFLPTFSEHCKVLHSYRLSCMCIRCPSVTFSGDDNVTASCFVASENMQWQKKVLTSEPHRPRKSTMSTFSQRNIQISSDPKYTFPHTDFVAYSERTVLSKPLQFCDTRTTDRINYTSYFANV